MGRRQHKRGRGAGGACPSKGHAGAAPAPTARVRGGGAPARQIADAAADARPQQSIARCHVVGVVLRDGLSEGAHVGLLHFGLQDDRDDDAVDGHRFAEDNTARAAAGWATCNQEGAPAAGGGQGSRHGALRSASRLIRFLERMRGARTAAPSRDEPVMKMPQAAPSTDRPMARPAPMNAHRNGSRSWSTLPQSS